MIDEDLGYKYATQLQEAEKAYRDSEGDLDSAVIATQKKGGQACTKQ